jgi:hypothetical protein
MYHLTYEHQPFVAGNGQKAATARARKQEKDKKNAGKLLAFTSPGSAS